MQHGRTAKQMYWVFFFNSMVLLMLGRLVVEVVLFRHSQDILVQSSPQLMKEKLRLNINISERETTVLVEAPTRPKWLDISPDSDDLICETDDTFQFEIAFTAGPSNQYSIAGSVQNANACCKQCELREKCTHWTFEVSNGNCVTTDSSPNPVNAIDRQGAISARVSLDKYIERRHPSSIPTPAHGWVQPDCAFDEADRPFLDDSYNKSTKTRGIHVSPSGGGVSAGAPPHK